MLPIVIVVGVTPTSDAELGGPEPAALPPDCPDPPAPAEPPAPEAAAFEPPGTTAEPPGPDDAAGPPGAEPWAPVPSDCCCWAVKEESGRRVPQAVSASTAPVAATARSP